MTNVQRILDAIGAAPGPVCDDCLSRRTGVEPRQQVNVIARSLEMEKLVVRSRMRPCAYCRGAKITNARTTSSTVAAPVRSAASPGSLPAATSKVLAVARFEPPMVDTSHFPWHWEGHVQASLRRHLEEQGWSITRAAVTETKETGVDLVASRNEREILIEVKGFPLTTYAYGPKQGTAKPTRPTNQARQWFSHALLSVMRLCDANPDADVALAFPDFATYRKLVATTRKSLRRLGVGVFLVAEGGKVETLIQPGDSASPSP